MLMFVSMTLTLMPGHSGSAKAKYQRCMLSATKQAISFKLATTVGHFYVTLTLQTFIVWLGGFSSCVQYFRVSTPHALLRQMDMRLLTCASILVQVHACLHEGGTGTNGSASTVDSEANLKGRPDYKYRGREF